IYKAGIDREPGGADRRRLGASRHFADTARVFPPDAGRHGDDLLARAQRRDCARSGRNDVDEAVAGLRRPLPSVLLFVFYGMSFTLMTFAVKKIDMSLSYAICSGVGTALIALIGFGWFKEPLTTLKIVSIVLIVAGVFGLNASVRAG
ncbi:MAG: multidrug efflux SMR transporter, partial [Betaproteobacteria bacterium]